ncbi:ubiquitin-binding protein cue5 [Neurospora sp. IMI 360204]|nr:ubiquitin-binding protein cue5 [Neurospora sp. IMI 360204]
MSAPTDSNVSKHATVEPAPESPTTARPLEMDDDEAQENVPLGTDTTTTATTQVVSGSDENPPPKPPRPVSEEQKNQQILKEAFPSIDPSVIKAVLRASRGQIEPAFNALLEMTDPDAVQNDDVPPPPPPRPAATDRSQLEADEIYARQLAEHFESTAAYEARTANRGTPGSSREPTGPRGPHMPPRPRQGTGLKPNELYDDREHSFIDDDLPVIKESLRKGFIETQSKVNSWFTTIKKKIDETFDEDEEDQRRQNESNAFIGRPTRNQQRRSADYDRYDADPTILSDDFAGMKFNNDGTPYTAQSTHQQLYSNPHAFRPRPPSKSPKSSDGRRVSFRDTVEDINAYDASPRIQPKDSAAAASGGSSAAGSATKTSKWQPLSSVDPNPIADNDPFSLGDSDDEFEHGHRRGSSQIKMEDTTATDADHERLRQATADAMADSLVEGDKTKKSDEAK